MTTNKKHGFTLVELSIILVIIGLIVGGVMVGQDLIKAAAIRSQISQIEQYNTAVNAFKLKYGYLPGDIPEPDASDFGFKPRGLYDGQGDGDGCLTGTWANITNYKRVTFVSGENAMFWVDLYMSNLIKDKLNTATSSSSNPGLPTRIPKNFLPTAKINSNSYILAFTTIRGSLGKYISNCIHYLSIHQ